MDVTTIHLGHPLILPTKERSADYTFIYDRFRFKLNAYQAIRLSHAARLTLIKSVFSFIPVYYMSNILFSKKLILKLTAIIWWSKTREDSNTKSLCLRSWADIRTTKQDGGIAICNLQAINHCLILYTVGASVKTHKATLLSSFKQNITRIHNLEGESQQAQVSLSGCNPQNSPLLKKMQASMKLLMEIPPSRSPLGFPSWDNIHNNLIIQPHPFVYPAVVKYLCFLTKILGM
jgi:hypothetical protein